MGGLRSTRWKNHTKALQVEDCLALDTRWLVREGMIGPNRHLSRVIAWGERDHIKVTIRTREREGSAVLEYLGRVEYDWGPVREVIPLETTHDGWKWWWRCQRFINGEACVSRVAILYLPHGHRLFGCRKCYGLKHRSCQERGVLTYEQRIRRLLFRRLTRYRKMGGDPAEIDPLLAELRLDIQGERCSA